MKIEQEEAKIASAAAQKRIDRHAGNLASLGAHLPE
jgi:hypothetical protein